MNVDFKTVRGGQWVRPIRNGYLMQCCDCGLVHKIDFKVVRNIGERHRLGNHGTDRRRYSVEFRASRVSD